MLWYQNNENTYHHHHHHHHHTCASPAVDGADPNATRCATHLKLGEESVPVGNWCYVFGAIIIAGIIIFVVAAVIIC
jgi:hypothetical protein